MSPVEQEDNCLYPNRWAAHPLRGSGSSPIPHLPGEDPRSCRFVATAMGTPTGGVWIRQSAPETVPTGAAAHATSLGGTMRASRAFQPAAAALLNPGPVTNVVRPRPGPDALP